MYEAKPPFVFDWYSANILPRLERLWDEADREERELEAAREAEALDTLWITLQRERLVWTTSED